MSRLFQFLVVTIVMASPLVSGCISTQTKTTSGAPLARQISQSAHCGLTAPGHLHLESRNQVSRLEALPERSLPLDPIKMIDFSQEHVVLVALGQKRTGGFSVTLVGSKIVDQQLELTVLVLGPEPGSLVTQVLTTPCAVIAVTAAGWNTVRILPAEYNR
ncbi:MAG TPA: protease complex subunit PrcB family protein [Marinobacter sp.]|nr:protease complex subunit PrcB family protein [Marinobacter sp.]